MKMMFKVVAFGLVLLLPFSAYPATPTEDLGTCLIDALNGKERKQLAKWIFFAMASHPEISSFSNATSQDIESTDKSVGQLVTRLLTEDCPSEMRLANDSNPLALQKAFELVGQVAMQEIMTSPQVNEAIVGYAKYADMDKIGSILVDQNPAK